MKKSASDTLRGLRNFPPLVVKPGKLLHWKRVDKGCHMKQASKIQLNFMFFLLKKLDQFRRHNH